MREPRVFLCGAIARTLRGRELLAEDAQGVMPGTFATVAEAGSWWQDRDAGLVLGGATQDCCVSTRGSRLLFEGLTHPRRALHGLLDDFERNGAGTLERLCGSFAIAYWDVGRRELLLARDALGQGIVFTRENREIIYFCSRIEPLLEDSDFPVELDFESAFNYLAFGNAGPGRTLAKRIGRVPAAHFVSWRPAGALHPVRYYSPLTPGLPATVDAPQRAEFLDRLNGAITACSSAEPQALLLSSGLDSSLLAALSVERESPKNLVTYTADFGGPPERNESLMAAEFAAQLGLPHVPVHVGIDDARRGLTLVLQAAEPCSTWTTITHLQVLHRIASDGIRDALSGMGADEVFGGYRKFLDVYVAQRRLHLREGGRQDIDVLDRLLMEPESARRSLFRGIPVFFNDYALRRGLGEPFRMWSQVPQLVAFYRECRTLKYNANLIELMVAHECQHRIPELLLNNFEMVGRHAGVRVAYPFLDPKSVRHACALGASERFGDINGAVKNKLLLRQLAARHLPDSVLRRPSMIYTAPILSWISDKQFRERLLTAFESPVLLDTGLIATTWRRRILEEVGKLTVRPNKHNFHFMEQMWGVATLGAWCDRWIRKIRS